MKQGRQKEEASQLPADRSPDKSPLSHKRRLEDSALWGQQCSKCNCQRGQVPWYEDTPGVLLESEAEELLHLALGG